jgi:hypothetical protein
MEFVAVKAVMGDAGEWHLEILGVPFGGPINGKDRDQEYFHEGTKIHEDVYKTIPVNYFHALDPKTGRPTGNPEYIGVAKYLRKDSKGHWYEVVLDKTKEMAVRVWEAAWKGIAAASSESLPNLIRTSAGGRIDNWPVAGMAVLDVREGRAPVNGYAVAIPMMKAIYSEAGIPFPEMKSDNVLSEAEQATRKARIEKIKSKSNVILKKVGTK